MKRVNSRLKWARHTRTIAMRRAHEFKRAGQDALCRAHVHTARLANHAVVAELRLERHNRLAQAVQS